MPVCLLLVVAVPVLVPLLILHRTVLVPILRGFIVDLS